MNVKIPYSWLKEYLETDASPLDMQKYLSLCGPSIERIDEVQGDSVFDIEITTNRIDAVSIYGIAREANAVLSRFGKKSSLKPYVVKKPEEKSDTFQLFIEDKDHHIRRTLAVVMEIDKPEASPQWMKERLEKTGVRSLNNIIDITNYVMLEVGHPTHVFDYDRLQTGKLIFRNAKKGEKYITLDNKSCSLDEKDIIIEDGTGRIVDLPGIMGAANSVVTNESKRIIFFIENDDPRVIRRTSMRLAVRTMAASINEKNPDPYLAQTAFYRGIELFQKLAQAKIASPLYDIFEKKDIPKTISLTREFIEKRMGVNVDTKQIITILESLEFIVKVNNDSFQVTPPTFRMYDVTIPEDIVEEVARIYGYNNLPDVLPKAAHIRQPKEFELLFKVQDKSKLFLKHLGLHEAMNYSMISKKAIENIQGNIKDYLKLSNTISNEIEYMRTSLAPSLMQDIRQNTGKKETLKFFEVAKTYLPRNGDLPLEIYHLGIVTNTDYSDLKGILEALFLELHIGNVEFKVGINTLFSPGAVSDLYISGKKAGSFGLVKPETSSLFGIERSVYLAELDLDSLVQNYKLISYYNTINQFSRIKLDLTIELPKGITYQNMVTKSHQSSKLLDQIEYLGKYENKLNLRLFFESKERNITEEEAKTELLKIEASLHV